MKEVIHILELAGAVCIVLLALEVALHATVYVHLKKCARNAVRSREEDAA